MLEVDPKGKNFLVACPKLLYFIRVASKPTYSKVSRVCTQKSFPLLLFPPLQELVSPSPKSHLLIAKLVSLLLGDLTGILIHRSRLAFHQPLEIIFLAPELRPFTYTNGFWNISCQRNINNFLSWLVTYFNYLFLK
ncbi:MAG: hypothetical protein CLLPBCKN_000944 [Chroococcidiopsis cubana SAG 39.79]|nr:hypothetical protein [Chroococcidiopsis cubana SAG 39.79]